MNIFLIFIGGGIGSVLRYLTNRTSLSLFGESFPYGILAINVIGSFLIGLAAAYIKKSEWAGVEVISFVMIGILGGFTTFSAFSLDAVNLINQQRYTTAAVYVIASVTLSITAAFIGLSIK